MCSFSVLAGCVSAAAETSAAVFDGRRERSLGLLYGGLIGDALGGPVEFSSANLSDTLIGARVWSEDRQITASDLRKMAEEIPMLSYRDLRPEPAAYGPWQSAAVAGTLTDDSRHKIVLLRAIRRAHMQDREVSARDIARSFLEFCPALIKSDSQQDLAALCEEGFREYRYAARWLLGERDLELARPIERLWAGVNNCSGQMMFPPLALVFPGQPEQAYLRTFDLDFIDTPMARDLTAALTAGLSAVLAPELDEVSHGRRWQVLFEAMSSTDPFGFGDVPFAGRQLQRWMEKADEFVDRSQGRPARLYQLLETEGQPTYWWDAHFTLLVPMCMIKFCKFNPLAAMHLTLDFGHDTDSYAQVLGCMIGGVHGVSVFPNQMVAAVQTSLDRDYAESVDSWYRTLTREA